MSQFFGLIPLNAANFESGAAEAGQVLTADGTGGAGWQPGGCLLESGSGSGALQQAGANASSSQAVALHSAQAGGTAGRILGHDMPSGTLMVDPATPITSDIVQIGDTVVVQLFDFVDAAPWTPIEVVGVDYQNQTITLAGPPIGMVFPPSIFYTRGVSGAQALATGRSLALGDQSHAEGLMSIAAGTAAHAEGSSLAMGDSSHAEGGASAMGINSHAEGMAIAGGIALAYTSYTAATHTFQMATTTGNLQAGQILMVLSEDGLKNDMVVAVDPTAKTVRAMGDPLGRNSTLPGWLLELSPDPVHANQHAEGVFCIAYARNTHVGGSSCMAMAPNAHAMGDGCQARGYNSFATGSEALAIEPGAHAEANGDHAWNGDAQHERLFLRRQTTDATPLRLSIGGDEWGGTAGSGNIPIRTHGAVTFRAQIVAETAGATQVAGWVIEGVIKNLGGTASILSGMTKVVLGADNPAWDVAAVAEGSNLSLFVTGAAGATIRWFATVYTAESLFLT